MLHHVAHTVGRRLLFHSMVEGVDLFHRLDRLPIEALCLMPDHVHLVAARDVRRPLAAVLSGWARRCNTKRGATGALMEKLPDGVPLVDREKVLRAIRYVHLNPCRAGLVRGPLGWPLSTHRDAVGLALRRVGPSRRAEWFHRYVSGDPSVAHQGSELPKGPVERPTLIDVLHAVSSVTRTPWSELHCRRTRGLVVMAAEELAGVGPSKVAAALRCHRASVYRVDPVPREALALVQRVVGDPRFRGIGAADQRSTGPWRRYLAAR